MYISVQLGRTQIHCVFPREDTKGISVSLKQLFSFQLVLGLLPKSRNLREGTGRQSVLLH